MMSIVRKPWRPIWLVYLAVVLASLACSLPAMSTSAAATELLPSPTLAPTITPTPTPLPAARLDEAEQARFYGDWERALTLFESIRMQSSDLSVQQEAAYGIALTYSQDLRFPEAIQELSVLISQAEDPELRARAYYLRAAARIEIGEYLSAAEDYQGYLETRPGVMDEAVSELRGDALFAGGDYAAAQAAYREALLAAGDALQPALEIKLARSFAAGGDLATALALYNGLYARVDDPYTLATLDYLMGLAYTELGDLDSAYARYLDAVANYPDAYDSYAGLVLLVEAGVPVDEFQRGLIDYYAGQYGVAIAAFDRFLAAGGGDLRPETHYYRGLANRAAGDYYAALNDWETLITFYPESYFWDDAWEEKAYTEWAYLDDFSSGVDTLLGFVAAAPDHPRAAEFLFDAASVRERMNWLDDAVFLWTRVAQEYPASDYAFRSQFQAGITRYRQADYAAAQTAFQAAFDRAVQPEDQAAAMLWVGKSAAAVGDSASAAEAWQLAAAADEDGYYSLRAQDLLLNRAPFETQGVPDFITTLEPLQLQAEGWLRLVLNLEEEVDLRSPGDLMQEQRFQRGAELWALGEYGQAQLEFEDLRLEMQTDALRTYRLMQYFLDIGLYRSAIYAAVSLSGIAEDLGGVVPTYFDMVRFGPYFGDLILSESLAQGLDSLFVLSITRQESLFESFATSYAYAYGLMQVIPDTGEYLALQLGWPPDFIPADLYRPVVSVRFGTAYLAIQDQLFDGDPYAMLAAYNAGPGNALIWQAEAQGDPDLFLEIVRLSQPRDYIRSIAWAYAHYQALYLP